MARTTTTETLTGSIAPDESVELFTDSAKHIIALAEKIELSQETTEKLQSLINKSSARIYRVAVKCRTKGFQCLRGKPQMFVLAVILKLAVDVKAEYDKAGIDEKIYYDTMSDIKIWCDKTDGKGLKNYGWLKNHVSFGLFRLGRLQFQPYECKNKTLLYAKLPFGYGEKLIYVHIPEGESLDEEKCRAAFETAKDFFGRFFPQYDYGYFFCESWLLFDGNRDFMSKDSNILKFMSLFDICYSVKFDGQAIERIFGKRRLFKRNYSEKTSLQRSAKQYMLSGKQLGIGIGVRKA